MSRNLFITIISSLLIFLFVYTGVNKIVNFKAFSAGMHNQPLPAALINILIWAVPFFELAAAGLLLFHKTRLAGLYASFMLMTAFTVYTAFVLLNFFEFIPCSCSGIISSLTWQQHLLLNLFFTVLSVAGILSYPVKNKYIPNVETIKKYFVRIRE